MITNHLFGNQHLHQRLGNQLFQFASLTGIAHHCRATLKLPFGWTAAPYFQIPDGIFLDEVPRPDITIHEPSFGYSLEWLKHREVQMQREAVNIYGIYFNTHIIIMKKIHLPNVPSAEFLTDDEMKSLVGGLYGHAAGHTTEIKCNPESCSGDCQFEVDDVVYYGTCQDTGSVGCRCYAVGAGPIS